jgi:hypothetical protein
MTTRCTSLTAEPRAGLERQSPIYCRRKQIEKHCGGYRHDRSQQVVRRIVAHYTDTMLDEHRHFCQHHLVVEVTGRVMTAPLPAQSLSLVREIVRSRPTALRGTLNILAQQQIAAVVHGCSVWPFTTDEKIEIDRGICRALHEMAGTAA